MFSSIVIFPVIAGVVFLFIVIRFTIDTVVKSVLMVAISVITVAVIYGIAESLIIFVPATFVQVFERGKIRIVALPSSTATKGIFFLELGKTGGIPYYSYYKKTSAGGKIFTSVLARYVTIYNGKKVDGNYIAEVYSKKIWSNNGWLFNFFVPAYMHTQIKEVGYAIHVPKGSIRENLKRNIPPK